MGEYRLDERGQQRVSPFSRVVDELKEHEIQRQFLLRNSVSLRPPRGPAENSTRARLNALPRPTMRPDEVVKRTTIRLASISADGGANFLAVLDWAARKVRGGSARRRRAASRASRRAGYRGFRRDLIALARAVARLLKHRRRSSGSGSHGSCGQRLLRQSAPCRQTKQRRRRPVPVKTSPRWVALEFGSNL